MSHMIQNSCMRETIKFSAEDDLMWHKLYTKQFTNIQDKAFSIFLKKLKEFDLPVSRVPQLYEVSDKIYSATKWQVVPVSGLVEYNTYFSMLAERKFQSATNIRSECEEDLSKDPDIFHELFGHCTMLLSQEYADFMQEFAKFSLTLSELDRPLITRLIWFTTETGLIKTEAGTKIYGSSIMSSYAETLHSLKNTENIHKSFDIVNIFREPFRADILQRVYYVIEDIKQVYSLVQDPLNLITAMRVAREMGEYPPLFPVTHNKYSNIGHCVPLEVTA